MKYISIVLLCLIFFCNMCYGGETLSNSGYYSYDLNITPSEDKDNVFICKLIVKDLENDKILCEPQIITAAGEEAMMEIGDKKGINIKVKILVSKEKSSCTYSIETSRSEHIINMFTGTMVFEK